MQIRRESKTVMVAEQELFGKSMPIPVLFPHQVREAWGVLRLKKRFLILGTGQLAVDLHQVFLSEKQWSIKVVGFLDEREERVGERVGSSDIVGIYSQFLQMVEEHRVDAIAVCLEDSRSVLPIRELLDCKAMGLDIYDGHKLLEEVSGRLSIDSLRPSALVFSTGFRRRLPLLVGKRMFDVAVSAVGLVLLLPFLCFVAALIRLDSPGPVFYRQVRVGLRGHPYMIWKFRSMCRDAEKSGPRWAQTSDPRISRIGWWLRKTRIDELPQLVNVLRGEMSLVGPRPERPVFVQDLRKSIPYYDIRHTIKPGITGWAQVRFRYGASQEDAHRKLQYDLYYVKNFTFLLDLKVLVRTIRVVIFGEGAH